ncbi:DUF6009 family protein [Streptomyces phaeoluteigriseus]|uniref:DUF6009 family protein n=1 Tax=Streptomyces phaeoluteigriseus TaxID=114686 RepID=A0ABY4Z996_9ACTN|nr:DUF6009 family protein [Streptomyces phaeoluteigriseus]USQ85613.1 DUF6009 family protein [Streptomyces phaeoluteigriseus]
MTRSTSPSPRSFARRRLLCSIRTPGERTRCTCSVVAIRHLTSTANAYRSGPHLLGPTAKPSRASGTFRRRVFWLLPHDRDTRPEGPYAESAPAEAVDPRTLGPQAKGYKTERSGRGPASTAMQEFGRTLPL